MTTNKSKFILPIIGATVVAGTGFAAYNYFLKGPSGDGADAIASAKIVPEKALMVAYITTEPKAWAKLQQFGTPEAQKIFAKGIEEFNKSTAKENISYEKDLKPWVGGIMFAVLPPNTTKAAPAKSSSPEFEPGFLMVVGIKDKVAALNFANKLKSQKDLKIIETDYKGIKISEEKDATKDPQENTPTYSAIIDNSYVVMAPEKRSIEQAIDTYKGQPSLASKQETKEILSKGTNLQNTLVQIYIPSYYSIFESVIQSDPELQKQIPIQSIEQLKQMKSMVAGIGIDDAGIRMKAKVNYDAKLSKYQSESSESKIIANFPTETIALINGKGIKRGWEALLEQSKDFPELQTALGAARTYTKYSNIDLDREVFSWMDGEFALAAIPSNEGLLAQTGFGGALVFDTKDEKTTKSMFAKLDNLAKTQKVNVKQRNAVGKQVTEWEIPQEGALLAHGWIDQDTVFVALGSPIADVMLTKKTKSLADNDSFKQITSSLQKPNGGYFYLDIDKTMTLVNKFATGANAVDPEAQAILGSMRGISMTVGSGDQSSSQMEMLLSLKAKGAK